MRSFFEGAFYTGAIITPVLLIIAEDKAKLAGLAVWTVCCGIGLIVETIKQKG